MTKDELSELKILRALEHQRPARAGTSELLDRMIATRFVKVSDATGKLILTELGRKRLSTLMIAQARPYAPE